MIQNVAYLSVGLCDIMHLQTRNQTYSLTKVYIKLYYIIKVKKTKQDYKNKKQSIKIQNTLTNPKFYIV